MIIYGLGLVLIKFVSFLTVMIRNVFADIWTKFYAQTASIKAMQNAAFAANLIDHLVGWNFVVYSITFSVYIILFIKVVRLIIGLISKG